jgi:Mg2+ and Co2+ transporter CorA
LLTVVSTVMLPLFVITGIFGMNVAFPGEGGREAFWAILGGMIAALLAMVGFFRWRGWL